MISETWVPVVGFEELYEVSDLGRVRSVERDLLLPCGETRHYKSKVLRGGKDSKGYLTGHLTDGKKKRAFRFHRVAAEAFIPNPLGLPQVNHIDGNKENNAISNLEWVTDAQNKAHAVANGLTPLFDKDTGRWKRRCA